MGHDTPIIECGLFNKGDKIFLLEEVDTGAYVTIITHSEWSERWELVPANGVISGIEGAATSMRSKRTILIDGPEGQIAMVRPFVVRATITL